MSAGRKYGTINQNQTTPDPNHVLEEKLQHRTNLMKKLLIVFPQNVKFLKFYITSDIYTQTLWLFICTIALRWPQSDCLRHILNVIVRNFAVWLNMALNTICILAEDNMELVSGDSWTEAPTHVGVRAPLWGICVDALTRTGLLTLHLFLCWLLILTPSDAIPHDFYFMISWTLKCLSIIRKEYFL